MCIRDRSRKQSVTCQRIRLMLVHPNMCISTWWWVDLQAGRFHFHDSYVLIILIFSTTIFTMSLWFILAQIQILSEITIKLAFSEARAVAGRLTESFCVSCNLVWKGTVPCPEGVRRHHAVLLLLLERQDIGTSAATHNLVHTVVTTFEWCSVYHGLWVR